MLAATRKRAQENIHSPSQPRGMTNQYALTTRAPALSLLARGGGLIYSLRWYMEDHDRA